MHAQNTSWQEKKKNSHLPFIPVLHLWNVLGTFKWYGACPRSHSILVGASRPFTWPWLLTCTTLPPTEVLLATQSSGYWSSTVTASSAVEGDHILEWCNVSKHVVVGSHEVWHHLEQGASRNAGSSNFVRQTLEHSSFRRQKRKQSRAKQKRCASSKNLSSQITREKKENCTTYPRRSKTSLLCTQTNL